VNTFRAAVLTISDRSAAGRREDATGPRLVERLAEVEAECVVYEILPDEREQIEDRLRALVGTVDLIVTTGGTGIGPRDVTPEAAAAVIDRPLPGFGEIMRTASFAKTPLSIISRGGAGLAGNTLLVLLPGSPKGALECFDLLAPAIRHVMQIVRGQVEDCARARAAYGQGREEATPPGEAGKAK